MSEHDAFLAAIRAAPEDDTARLAFADWLDEQEDAPDQWRACAEFVRLSCRGGRALPVKAGKWLWERDPDSVTPKAANWKRLVPELAAWIEREREAHHLWAVDRRGRWLRVFGWPAHWTEPQTCEIEFFRGFVGRAVFDAWQFADLVLPLLVADQPFVAPELRGFARLTNEYGDRLINRDTIGPAIDFITSDDFGSREDGARLTLWRGHDAEARARKAVAAALLERARLIRAGVLAAGVDVVANAGAVAASELGTLGVAST